jgi:DeoR/GlpR family transcriptional regulator of sugar metabolism
MWKAERFQRIRTALKTFGKLTIESVAKDLEVSSETVRRDFKELEDLGELKRVRGGVKAMESGSEAPISQRTTEQVKEKRAIARAAAPHIQSGQVLFVDAGSTTTLLADELARISGITVITNSVDVAVRINQPKSRVANENKAILLGGMMHDSLLATFGDKTVGEIYNYCADLALLSPVGIDAEYGATSFDPAEAEVARAMVANARQVLILADHTKLGVVSRVSYCRPERIDLLITDEKSLKSPHFAKIKEAFRAVCVDSQTVKGPDSSQG